MTKRQWTVAVNCPEDTQHSTVLVGSSYLAGKLPPLSQTKTAAKKITNKNKCKSWTNNHEWVDVSPIKNKLCDFSSEFAMLGQVKPPPSLSKRGSLYYQSKQGTIFRGNPSNPPYICINFDPPKTSWPLVGNEGMNPQYTNVKVDSLIPY